MVKTHKIATVKDLEIKLNDLESTGWSILSVSPVSGWTEFNFLVVAQKNDRIYRPEDLDDDYFDRL